MSTTCKVIKDQNPIKFVTIRLVENLYGKPRVRVSRQLYMVPHFTHQNLYGLKLKSTTRYHYDNEMEGGINILIRTTKCKVTKVPLLSEIEMTTMVICQCIVTPKLNIDRLFNTCRKNKDVTSKVIIETT